MITLNDVRVLRMNHAYKRIGVTRLKSYTRFLDGTCIC